MSEADVAELRARLERIEALLLKQQPATDGLLSIDQVAAMLAQSRRSVERLVEAGRLRKVSGLGARTTRFRRADVERVLAARDELPGRRRL